MRMTQPKENERLYHSELFIEALTFAARAHQTQARKRTEIPYISHLMSVSAIVMEAGGSETEWIAALLHDSIEDTETSLAEVRAAFGKDVARIVKACSDYDPATDGSKKPAWHARKAVHINHLRTARQDELLVTVADKIHNGESIINDLETVGKRVWNRFNATPIDTRWYYASVLEVADKRLKNRYAVERLRRLVRKLDAAVASLDRA